MPTVYRQPKRSLQRNAVPDRQLELWEKHCAERSVDSKTTLPVRKHPRQRKTD